MEVAHPGRMGVQGDLSFREVQDYFSVHHKEVREVELTQKG